MLTEHNALWCKSLLQHRVRLARIRTTAHENIECGIPALGPGVDTDVAFGQHSNATDTAARRKGMQVNVEEGYVRRFHLDESLAKS